MAADQGMSVTVAELAAHAGQLDRIADQVRTAKDAGLTVQMGAEAYGKLCMSVPILVNGLQSLLVAGIATAVNSLTDTTDRLRTLAENYAAVDDENSAALQRAGGLR